MINKSTREEMLKLALRHIGAGMLGYSIGRSDVQKAVWSFTFDLGLGEDEADKVASMLTEQHVDWIVKQGVTHVEVSECVRYHAFIENFDRLKMILGEMGLLDKDPVVFEEDGTREKLMCYCIERMEDNFGDFGNSLYDLLRQGFKGYEGMSDVELIEDFLEGRPEDYRDSEWFAMPLTNEIEKAVAEKVSICIEQARKI